MTWSTDNKKKVFLLCGFFCETSSGYFCQTTLNTDHKEIVVQLSENWIVQVVSYLYFLTITLRELYQTVIRIIIRLYVTKAEPKRDATFK